MEDVPPTLCTQLLAHIPRSDIEVMRGFNKTVSYPSDSLWLNIDRPNFRMDAAFDRAEDVGPHEFSPQKPNDRKDLEFSQSHPPPDLALARAPEVEQERQSTQPE